MRRILALVLLAAVLGLAGGLPVQAQQGNTVTLIHFSDYHSHAVPFYAAGQPNTAGIARVLAYLKPRAEDPRTLIFSGGDTMNKGTPAWSDKYHCIEWAWLNGIVDAMAFGNHDADYGPEVFADCQAGIAYPILSSNTLAADGQPLFQHAGKTYQVFESGGVKIGVFALAGADFERLVGPAIRPAAGATFADRVQTATQVVQQLREQEQVNAVVLIGHALYEDDVALARAVPGIDAILGTHSHRQQELITIEGTNTRYIAPFQYLTYLSQVDLAFAADGSLAAVTGQLVPMGSDLPEDPGIAAQVAQLQRDLVADPQYAPLFQEIGAAAVELSTAGQFTGEAVLGNLVLDVVRSAAQTHLALSTSSSFREPIAPGVIIEESVRTAMPYPNKILEYPMTGAQIQALLDFSVSKSGSDFFAQVSGVRFNIVAGKATNIQILRDPANAAAGFAPLDAAATYRVATTDFLANVAGGYKDLFAGLTPRDTGLEVREQFRGYVKANSPVTGQLDGRIVLGAPAVQPTPPAAPGQLPNTGRPAQLPNTSTPSNVGWWLLLAGAMLATLGLALRRRMTKNRG
jgi:5'-nucleotidase